MNLIFYLTLAEKSNSPDQPGQVEKPWTKISYPLLFSDVSETIVIETRGK
jgi:hypothetical protein